MSPIIIACIVAALMTISCLIIAESEARALDAAPDYDSELDDTDDNDDLTIPGDWG